MVSLRRCFIGNGKIWTGRKLRGPERILGEVLFFFGEEMASVLSKPANPVRSCGTGTALRLPGQELEDGAG